MRLYAVHRDPCGTGCLLTVPQTISHGHQGPSLHHLDEMQVPRLGFTRHLPPCHSPFDNVETYLTHLIAVTVVPRPSRETIANSSIIRRTPGKPRPRPPDVE